MTKPKFQDDPLSYQKCNFINNLFLHIILSSLSVTLLYPSVLIKLNGVGINNLNKVQHKLEKFFT